MDLVAALKRPEGKRLELKRDLSSPDGVLRTIVAFANSAGGTLLIGVDDAKAGPRGTGGGERRVRGLEEPLDLEERLTSLISDGIAPRLLPEIEIVPWRRTHVLAVNVHPSGLRPHHLKREGPEDGVYVRLGSTNRRADRDLIEELRRQSRGESFDEQPMPGLGVETLDFRAASESFAGVRRLTRPHLETLRLVAMHQGRKVLTAGGVLLFGRERSRLFPDAWIQAGRFAGTQKVTILDQLEIRCYPIPAIEAAAGFVRKHSLHGAEIGPVRRTERWSLPPIAVREALVNAVVHADYSQKGAPIRVAIFDDRLEVENPGILLSGLTIEDLRRGVSRLRNRVLGPVFHELSLIEQWGSGVLRMTEACREAGLPPPLLEEIGTRFRVTLFTARSTHAGETARDPVDQSILDVLASEGRSTRAIAAAIALTPRATRTRLIRLVEQGLVQEIGSSPQDPKRLYYLSGSLASNSRDSGSTFRYGDSTSRPETRESSIHEHELEYPAPGKRRH